MVRFAHESVVCFAHVSHRRATIRFSHFRSFAAIIRRRPPFVPMALNNCINYFLGLFTAEVLELCEERIVLQGQDGDCEQGCVL